MSMSFTAFERSFDLVKFSDHFNLRRRTELIVMLADKGITLRALSVTRPSREPTNPCPLTQPSPTWPDSAAYRYPFPVRAPRGTPAVALE